MTAPPDFIGFSLMTVVTGKRARGPMFPLVDPQKFSCLHELFEATQIFLDLLAWFLPEEFRKGHTRGPSDRIVFQFDASLLFHGLPERVKTSQRPSAQYPRHRRIPMQSKYPPFH